MNREQAKKNKKKFEKNDIALFLAPITALCYGLVYTLELGKYNYYGIPTSLIELDLNSLTSGILTLFPMLLIIFFFIYHLFFKIKSNKTNDLEEDVKKKSSKWSLVRDIATLVVLIYICGFIYGLYIKYFGNITYLIFILVMIFLVFIIFMIRFYKKENYTNTLITGILFFIIFSFSLGYIAPALNTHHVVIQVKNQNYILLENYKENFILSPVDLKTKTLKRELILKNIADDDYKIKREKIILKNFIID
jgi:TRAP-type uncharacterized transport system fused permease subunit